jgi:hypothetical protein
VLPVEFAQTVAGALIAALGGGVIVPVCDPVEVQPFAVTVTPTVVVPDAPAVKVMLLAFVALVIVPLVIVQAYVAPACAGTLAVLPVELAQSVEAAVIVGVGFAVIATLCVPLLTQPPELVTVTLSVVVPDAAALKVIVSTLVALVIAPLVIDHAYVAPASTGTLAVRPVELGQVEVGAVMVTEPPAQPVVANDGENSEVPLATVAQPAPVYEVAVATIALPATIDVTPESVKVSFVSGVVRHALPTRS